MLVKTIGAADNGGAFLDVAMTEGPVPVHSGPRSGVLK